MKPVIRLFFLFVGICLLAAGYLMGVFQKGAKSDAPIDYSRAGSNLEEYLSRRPPPIQIEELKSKWVNLLSNTSVKGQYSLYFEDLNSGAWFGINENDRYNQWSLLKVGVMVAVLKKIERREITLDGIS